MDFNWYVLAQCKAKNGGREEIFYTVEAGFKALINAEDFIRLCVQDESRFLIVSNWNLDEYGL